jgi:hypothetical protein
MRYTYILAHEEDFTSVSDSDGITSETDGLKKLVAFNDNEDGGSFVLLRSDENDTVFCYEKNKWVKYG